MNSLEKRQFWLHYYHNDTVLNETKTTSGTTSNYATNIIGVTGIEARNQSGTTGFFGKDLHGDVRYAFNSSCTKIADYTYDAWGNDATSSTSTWATENPVRYNGQYLDSETGMYYLRARYYDPQISRFISEDPHWTVDNMIYGDEPYTYTIDDINVYNQCAEKYANKMTVPDKLSILQANNVYSYCVNNPVNYYDMNGREVQAYGFGGTASLGIGYSGYYLWATDDKGNFGLFAVNNFSDAYGATLNGIYMIFPDMPSINKMNGDSISMGVSYGAYSGGMMMATDLDTGYVYYGTYAQYSYGTGLYDFYPGFDAGNTQMIFSGNIREISDKIKEVLNNVLPEWLQIE